MFIFKKNSFNTKKKLKKIRICKNGEKYKLLIFLFSSLYFLILSFFLYSSYFPFISSGFNRLIKLNRPTNFTLNACVILNNIHFSPKIRTYHVSSFFFSIFLSFQLGDRISCVTASVA